MLLPLLNSRVPMTALAILLVFISGLLIAASNDTRTKAVQPRHDEASLEPTPPAYSVKQQGQMIDIGSVLNEEILRLVKVSEPDWEVVKNDWSPQTESSYKIWRSGDKHVSLFLLPFESKQIADEKFQKSKNPQFSSLGIKGTEIHKIGDTEGFLREVNSVNSVNLTFLVQRFVVFADGSRDDVLRFARHFEEVLQAHGKRDRIDK